MQRIFFIVIILFVVPDINVAQTPSPYGAGSKQCSCMQNHENVHDEKQTCKCGGNCNCGQKMPINSRLQLQVIKHPYLRMMDTMMNNMDQLKLTDRLELNFLLQMIPHHKGAVEMAKYQIANGKDPEMIQLAKSILTEQLYEIQEMQIMFQMPSESTIVNIEIYKAAMDKTMMSMMKAMPADDSVFSSNDIAFAMIMLPHHQAAIDMSIALLQMNPHKMLINVAENIIVQQQVEVEQMRTYINQFKKN